MCEKEEKKLFSTIEKQYYNKKKKNKLEIEKLKNRLRLCCLIVIFWLGKRVTGDAVKKNAKIVDLTGR